MATDIEQDNVEAQIKSTEKPEDHPQAWQEPITDILDRADVFQQLSHDFSRMLHKVVLQQGENFRNLTDVVHGKQIGHPLHPILTDITITSWTLGLIFDVLGFTTRISVLAKAGDYLTGIGTMSAIPTALAGILDYSTIKKKAAQYGATHGIMNGIAFYWYLRSLKSRIGSNKFSAIIFSVLGLFFATAGSWLGGELVYRHKVGVNHAPESKLNEWTATIPLDDLSENEPVRVEAEGEPILLFRQGQKINAISAVCSHAGGPLDQGKVINTVCIECPWHQSVFDMRTGEIIHSPATTAQPQYAVRINNGKVEVKHIIA